MQNGRSRDTGNIGHKRHSAKTIKTQNNATQKIKKMSNTDPTKNRGWARVHSKSKQFLSIIRHPTYYLYRRDVPDTTIRIQTQIA